ncbi:hypothetical protein RCL1_004412 [Eukaryota sp. TZLM3-RCL]
MLELLFFDHFYDRVSEFCCPLRLTIKFDPNEHIQSFSARASNLIKEWSKNMEKGTVYISDLIYDLISYITDEQIKKKLYQRCHPQFCESKSAVEDFIRQIASFVENDHHVEQQWINGFNTVVQNSKYKDLIFQTMSSINKKEENLDFF